MLAELPKMVMKRGKLKSKTAREKGRGDVLQILQFNFDRWKVFETPRDHLPASETKSYPRILARISLICTSTSSSLGKCHVSPTETRDRFSRCAFRKKREKRENAAHGPG